ncbi:Voltage-dependent anion-selective channel protein 1 [Plecturocebus cupreus]
MQEQTLVWRPVPPGAPVPLTSLPALLGRVLLCCLGWSTVAPYQLMAASASWAKAILPPQPPRVSGIPGTYHQAWLIFVFLVEMEFCHVGQAGLKLPASSNPPASASQSAGTTGSPKMMAVMVMIVIALLLRVLAGIWCTLTLGNPREFNEDIVCKAVDRVSVRQSCSVIQAGVQWHNLSSLQPPPRGLSLCLSLTIETGFCHVGQACLKILDSSDLPTLASQDHRHEPPTLFYLIAMWYFLGWLLCRCQMALLHANPLEAQLVKAPVGWMLQRQLCVSSQLYRLIWSRSLWKERLGGAGARQKMAVPPTYADLGKSARDVFTKGYGFGLIKLDLKTKSENGLEFTSSGSANTETTKVTGSLETKYRWTEYGLTFTEKWNTDNTLGTEITLEDQLTGALPSCNACALPPRNPAMISGRSFSERSSLPGSRDPPSSASSGAGTTGASHHPWLIFIFLIETVFHHVAQASLKLLSSSDLPTLASQNAGMIDVSHHTCLQMMGFHYVGQDGLNLMTS